jgi:hypothetical protein
MKMTLSVKQGLRSQRATSGASWRHVGGQLPGIVHETS